LSIQITIIGLGQIGASVGLALANHTELVQCIGFDTNPETVKQAKIVGAVDEINHRLDAHIPATDVVILALPADQIRSTMQAVAPLMRPGAVLMDTAPIKAEIANWAQELLPEGCSYVGLTPVVSPQYLHSDEIGIGAARKDLFEASLIAITSPPRTDSRAVKLAADLVRLIGAQPFFADLLEVDGVMTAAHIVPQIMAAALLNATVDQPGWHETRKLAGRAYTEASGPLAHLGEPSALASTASLNRENVLRVLDGVISAMQALRKDINDEDAASLSERLERAYQGRQLWWKERQSGDWIHDGRPKMEMPPKPSLFDSLMGTRRKPLGGEEDK
jgi:prephenate dehydrogenase